MKPSDIKRALHRMLAWREVRLEVEDSLFLHDEAEALEEALERLGMFDEEMLERMIEKAKAKQ